MRTLSSRRKRAARPTMPDGVVVPAAAAALTMALPASATAQAYDGVRELCERRASWSRS
jgi:hypothetical protein